MNIVEKGGGWGCGGRIVSESIVFDSQQIIAYRLDKRIHSCQ